MSDGASSHELRSADVVRERARTLGLFGVRVDADAPAVVDPMGWGGDDGARLVERYAGSGFCLERLRPLLKEWDAEEAPAPRRLLPGCWAIPLIRTRRRRRAGYFLFLGFEQGGLRGEAHEEACRAAGIDAEEFAWIVGPSATQDARSVLAAARMLGWALQDREEVEGGEEAVCEFSTQLAESYEELSLLYKLGQSMGELVNPKGFVEFLCEELFATLSYGWLGVWLSQRSAERAGLTERCFLVGDPPVEAARIRGRLDDPAPEWFEGGPKVLGEAELTGAGLSGAGDPALLHPLAQGDRVVGAVLAGRKTDGGEISSVDMKLLDAAGANLRIFLENTALYAEQRAMFVGTLHALTAAIDAKDSYTSGHSERVAHLSKMLAEAAGLPAKEVERIEIAGLVHDVGKIGVPERVLCKTGRLTDEEFDLIKLHPRIGHNILKDIPQMSEVLPAVLSHHERWDGRGYPHGLEGEAIPTDARIVAVADSFDAMSSTRTYRAAMQRATVLREIERCAGTQFDPDLAPIFVTLDFGGYDQMVRKHLRSDERLSRMGDAA